MQTEELRSLLVHDKGLSHCTAPCCAHHRPHPACVLAAAIMAGEPGDDDASHWHWHLFYSNAADERILVPKRSPWMGWTFNFAHTESWVATGGLLAFAAACVASKKR